MSLSTARINAIATWLTANNIDPADVPIEATIIQDESAGVIRYTALIREGGRLQVAEPVKGQRIIQPPQPAPRYETRVVPLLLPAPESFPA